MSTTIFSLNTMLGSCLQYMAEGIHGMRWFPPEYLVSLLILVSSCYVYFYFLFVCLRVFSLIVFESGIPIYWKIYSDLGTQDW